MTISTKEQLLEILKSKYPEYPSDFGWRWNESVKGRESFKDLISMMDIDLFKEICSTNRSFLCLVRYDEIPSNYALEIVDIICKLFDRYSDSEYVPQIFYSAPLEYQMMIVDKMKDDPNQIYRVVNFVLNGDKKKLSFSIKDLYDRHPHIFEYKNILHLLSECALKTYIDEEFLSKTFDKIFPKETNLNLQDFSVRHMLSFDSRCLMFDRSLVYNGMKKDPVYFYDHIDFLPDLSKEYDEFLENFSMARKNLFKKILVKFSYSLDLAKSLGYEDVYHEGIKEYWINSPKKDNYIKNLNPQGEKGEEFILINIDENKLNIPLKDGLILTQRPNFSGLVARDYQSFIFDRNDNRHKNPKWQLKIMVKDIDCIVHEISNKFISPRKFEILEMKKLIG